MFRTGIIIAAIAALTIAAGLFAFRKNFDIVRYQKCDSIGNACCAPDSEVKTQHCHQGLGCNITTNKCDACGVPGQPCCDGDFTGFSLKGYNGILLDSKERIESCNAGSTCDARLSSDGKTWDGSRTCKACGTKENAACCAPDVRYALGRCFSDSTSGKSLTCNDPWAGAEGICIPCGSKVNEIACMQGRPCADRLVEQNGVCVFCGEVGNPVCDVGEPCYNRSVPNKSYTQCVAAGGANQPCFKDGTCGYRGMFCNAKKICELCGDGGQICCPTQVADRPCNVGACVNNRCFICGYENNPVCPGNNPCPHNGEPVNGFCRPCGKENQACCRSLSILCEDGMRCKEGTCKRPEGSSGTGEQWKTCSEQPYTWSTHARTIFIENEDGCIAAATYLASSDEEALLCARGQYGEAAIGPTVQSFIFAVTCPGTGCNQVTYSGRDHDSAESCVEASYLNCEVEDGAC
jgi:hypothetical protein